MTKKSIVSIHIGGMLEAIRVSEGGIYVEAKGVDRRRLKFDWSTSNVTPMEALKQVIVEKGLFIPDVENYWEFVTVNVEDEPSCNETALSKLINQLAPLFKFTHVHSSIEFTNVNYFTSNYLQYHVYKVEAK